MQTTLDVIDMHPDQSVLVLRCEHQTPQFVAGITSIGWVQTVPGHWMVNATPGRAEATRRLLGKGLLVTRAASDWYRQATA